MSELDPWSRESRDAHSVFAWLNTRAEVRLDASETYGLAATQLVVEDIERNGTWYIPLSGAIDFVDERDAQLALNELAHLRVTEMNDDTPAELQVLRTGTDDQLRVATVDLSVPYSFTLGV